MAITNPDLVTAVTPPSYRTGTAEKGAWDYLMAQRSACGFGLMQQDSRFDTAAAAHAAYLVGTSIDKSSAVSGHFEDATSPYFYGASPVDRVLRAGVPTSLGDYEILTSTYGLSSAGGPLPFVADEAQGAAGMRNLIETVYHALGAFVAGRSGGIGSLLRTSPHLVSGAADGYTFTDFALVLELASAPTQTLGTGAIATYPCAASTTVGGSFVPSTESPNPYPDAGSSAVYGTPIYFKADAGSTLVITSVTVTLTATGASVPIRQTTHASDPLGEVGLNEAFVTPTTALARGSRYTVNAAGTLNGVTFTKTFTFATAP